MATSLTTIIPNLLVQQYQKSDAKKALKIAGNFSLTYLISYHDDVSLDWQLLKTNTLKIDHHGLATKRFNSFRGPLV